MSSSSVRPLDLKYSLTGVEGVLGHFHIHMKMMCCCRRKESKPSVFKPRQVPVKIVEYEDEQTKPLTGKEEPKWTLVDQPKPNPK
mmetsp:Transcript_19886/g.36678  ORF Transcript_19886/g.36678 Transcript_19886/m.36678 type:complete len:85 (-) Transcript_19886:1933-2187(-)